MTEQPPDVRGSTGDGRVDAAVERLIHLDALDLPEQAAAFAQVHADLAAVLDGEGDAAPANDA